MRAGIFERPGQPILAARLPTVPPSRATRFARAIVRVAGRIYRPKAEEWWADLIYDQQVKNETGLVLASSCLLSSPALAWPHLRLQLAAILLSIAFDTVSLLVQGATALVVRLVGWSPQLVAVLACALVGKLLPINGVSHPELASLAILAPVGIYAGTEFPRALLNAVGAAVGAELGMWAWEAAGENPSILVFAVPGILLGGTAGSCWAEAVLVLRGVRVRTTARQSIVLPAMFKRASEGVWSLARIATLRIAANLRKRRRRVPATRPAAPRAVVSPMVMEVTGQLTEMSVAEIVPSLTAVPIRKSISGSRRSANGKTRVRRPRTNRRRPT